MRVIDLSHRPESVADVLVFLSEFLVVAEAFGTGSYPVAKDRSLKCVWFLKIHPVEESRQSSACPAALIRHSWRLSKIRIVTGGSKVGMVESRSKQDRSTQQVSGDGLVE